MPFVVSRRTLEQLDWAQVIAQLADYARTPQARAYLLAGDLFQRDEEAARACLAETGEARSLLDEADAPPIGGVTELEPALRRLAAGGAIEGRELLDLGRTLRVMADTRRFLEDRRELAPGLAERGATIDANSGLADDIEWALDPDGEVRDAASATLADARTRARRLSGELQKRLEASLRDPEIAEFLSDSFVTVRNDRYVLPVRADARGRVRGIVHDASGSGTTLFIEPEAVLELNNRLKQAELEAARETQRVLRSLSEQAAEVVPATRAGLEALVAIDAALARGRLSRDMDAVEPVVGRDGIFTLRQLRHPLLRSDEVVPNDLQLGDAYTVLVISGPNAGGKTVAMKALALAALFVRAGLHVPALPGARVDLIDALLADIGDEQDLRESLSTFSAHMGNLARIVDAADAHSLVVLDEVGVGTDPGEGAAIAQAALEALADAGTRVVATTHYNLLKELAEVDSRFENASVEFDPETLAPTYRLHLGAAGASSARSVAARMGLRSDVLERAEALLQREDRRLDKMLAELGTTRSALERERAEIDSLRAESEETRTRYREKLERLQTRRDELFARMRSDLDESFRNAHAEVATVIRQLQRGGATAQDAARARRALEHIDEKRREAEAKLAPTREERAELPRVDWRRARPGDPLRVAGGGEGTLVALPDKRGRVALHVGGARIVVPAERVSPASRSEEEASGARKRPRVRFEAGGGEVLAGLAGGDERVDFHGLRVEEALEQLALALERGARRGADRVVIVHGVGTGALRRAVRDALRRSPYVADVIASPRDEGGEGATIAVLR